MKRFSHFIAGYRKYAARSNSRMIVAITTLFDYLLYYVLLKRNDADFSSSPTNASIVNEIKKNGFFVIKDYLSQQECKTIKEEIDRLMGEFPHEIHPSPRADSRIFGTENLSNEIALFSSSDVLNGYANQYAQLPQKVAFTMAAKMVAKPGNLGSGEGWHRDAFYCQFKAILYVSDVTIDNGPFQFVKKSHRLRQILKDIVSCNLSYMQNRVDDAQVDCLTENNERLLTFTASAGTLLLVDTSAIHRGMPIQKGSRYALTNYYFPVDRINDALYKQFSPVVRRKKDD